MTIAVKPPRMSVSEFLDWTAGQSGRFELAGGEVIALSPERNRHIDLKMECWLALRKAVAAAKLPLHVSGDGLTVLIDEKTAREPDVTIQRLPIDPESTTAHDPVIVLEVVSPSSFRSDTGAKVGDYFRVPTIVEYVIVDSEGGRVIVHSRRAGSDTIQTRFHETGLIELQPGIAVLAESLLLGTEDRN